MTVYYYTGLRIHNGVKYVPEVKVCPVRDLKQLLSVFTTHDRAWVEV